MRNPALDALRGAAILLVFSRHIGLPIIGHFGWVGVDLFFVLSGFLVSGLLFREFQNTGHLQPWRFLIRRGFKIYPQFYFMIGLTVAWYAGSHLERGRVLSEIFFFQNYHEGLWGQTWSIAIEEHFYLLLALGLAWMARRGGFQRLPTWIGAICALTLALRVATWIWRPNDSFMIHVAPSHLRIDSLLAGVLLSYLEAFHAAGVRDFIRRFGAWVPFVSIALLLPASLMKQVDPFIYTIGFSLTSWAFGLLLLTALHPKHPPKAGAMAWLGRISYAFYLWQGPALLACETAGLGPWETMPLAFGGTLLIAWLTTRLIEEPFLRMRDAPSLTARPHADASIEVPHAFIQTKSQEKVEQFSTQS
jgi:peptidoglycan/LPS O-acetylase OafA/YrhL